MLISDSHRFIFVHIRKAAGTSVRRLIKPYAIEQPDDLLTKLKSKTGLGRDYQHFYFQLHSDIRLAQKTMPEELFQSYFKFTFVRNPWDRLVSEFEFIKKETGHGRHAKVIKMSFEEFIQYQSKRFEAHQVNMLRNQSGELCMDYVGKFENLHKDWQAICAKTGISFTELPHANRNKTRDYREYFDDSSCELVARLWRQDVEAFDYSFEPL